MRDFTLDTFRRLLTSLKAQNYTFQTFAEFLKNPIARSIILRHDVDARKMNSLQTARMEKDLGITGTYYFRMVPGSFDEEVIKQIANLGHEIGYHYEDLSRCAARSWRPAVGSKFKKGPHDRTTARPHDKGLPGEELVDYAIESFKENLVRLRRVVPVETICMHGSPLSRYDNRILWEKCDYRDFGIIGEPYFDLNFEEVLYLTDTGRRWDGEAVSIRDEAQSSGLRAQGKKERYEVRGMRLEEYRTLKKEHRKPHLASRSEAEIPFMLDHTHIFHFHSTFDIIRATESGNLSDKIMFTIHPQRWTNQPNPWMKELAWQNIKNVAKSVIKIYYRSNFIDKRILH